MTPAQYTFLRGLVASRSAQLRSAIAHEMARTQDLGRVRGGAVHYSPGDYAKAETKLRNAGLAIEAPPAGGARADAFDAASEKANAAPVTKGLVAVVPMGLPPETVHAPAGSFLALHWSEAMALPYQVLVVCENLEPMRRLHRYGWLAPYLKGRAALVLFRGAPTWFRTDAANALMQTDARPVLALFDFDPKGLTMAAALPRREGLCLPPWELLEPLVVERKRHDLYASQELGCRAVLDACPDSDVTEAWARMRMLTRGLNQEAFPEADSAGNPVAGL